MTTSPSEISSNHSSHREEDWAIILSSSDLDIDADDHDISPSRSRPAQANATCATSAATIGDTMNETELIIPDVKDDVIDDLANSAADDVIDDIFEHSYVYDLTALLPGTNTPEDGNIAATRIWPINCGELVSPMHAHITNFSVRAYNATLKCDLEDWQHRINAKEVRIGKSCLAEILLQWEKLAMAYVSYIQLWLEPRAGFLIYGALALGSCIPLMVTWNRTSQDLSSDSATINWLNSLIFDEELVPRWFLAPRRKRTIRIVKWASRMGANLKNTFERDNVSKQLWARALNSLLWVDAARNKLWVQTTCSNIWNAASSQAKTLAGNIKPVDSIYRGCATYVSPSWSMVSAHTQNFPRYVRLGASEVEGMMSTFASHVRAFRWT